MMILKEITANKRGTKSVTITIRSSREYSYSHPLPPKGRQRKFRGQERGAKGGDFRGGDEGVAFIWEMIEGKYTMTLSKIQVCANFHMRYIRRNVLAKFTEL